MAVFSQRPDFDQVPTGERVDQIRSSFEQAWKSGRQPQIEDYTGRVAESDRSELLRELVGIELTYRLASANPPTLREYCDRFPDAGDILNQLFENLPYPETVDRSFDDDSAVVREASQPAQAAGLTKCDSSETAAAPESIGRYSIKETLGAGAFGKVYLAQDSELDRLVAIKVPHPERVSAKPNDPDMYMSEARMVASLDHPGIVPVHDVGSTDDGRRYVVSKYIEGTDLAKKLRLAPLTWSESVEIVASVAEALHHAHMAGLVHRDIKPANILIQQDGTPFVTDFGLGIHEDIQRSRAGELAGTLNYMAPEQVRGEVHRLDGRTDIWALGVLLYQMLTGRRPFAGDSWDEISDEILHREPKPLRQIDLTIPAELERICRKCCAKDIRDRYATAMDVAHDLRRLSSTQKIDRSAVGKVVAIASLCGAAAVALAALFIFGPQEKNLGTPDKKHNGHAAPAAAQVDATIVSEGNKKVDRALANVVDVLIWNKAETGRQRLRLHSRGAMPLRTGDRVRVEAEVEEPAYLYIVWIDSQGKVTPVYPWTDEKDWSSRPDNEVPTDRVSLPEAIDEGWEMFGPSGMETLLLLVKDSPLPSSLNLRELLSDLPEKPLQHPEAVVWFADGAMVTNSVDRLRGPKFVAETIDDPLLNSQRRIQEMLGPHFKLIRAVSFANQAQ